MVEIQGFEPRMPEATDLQSAEVTNASQSPYILVPPAGFEPTLANYLLLTGYKSAVLPLNYRGTHF